MQPVVILGGFLITDEAYGPMAQWLKAQGGIDVSVVHASRVGLVAHQLSLGLAAPAAAR